MHKPTLCMVHNTVGNQSSIAKIAMWGVQQALNAGWQVTVVAHDLDRALQADVEWLRLYVPPRLHLVQWLAARSTIQAALGRRTFDVLHVHQAQVAALADVMQCHFLTRVAYERHCLESRFGLKPALARIQQQGVLRAEDYYYRHWNPKTRMLFDSELTRQDFQRLYGLPTQEQVLLYAAPCPDIPSKAERHQARLDLVGKDFHGIVVGYLGGVDERKGYKRLLSALEDQKDLFLLMGGPNSTDFVAPKLSGRFRSLGMVKDLATFYAACDVLAVPSLYEPFGLVALEAAARGVPVIATPEVGALPHLLEYGAGVAWGDKIPFGPLVQEVVCHRDQHQVGALRLVSDHSEQQQGDRLLAVYQEVLREKLLAEQVMT